MKFYVIAIAAAGNGRTSQEDDTVIANSPMEAVLQIAQHLANGRTTLPTDSADTIIVAAVDNSKAAELDRLFRN